jgi:hypothetical protein
MEERKVKLLVSLGMCYSCADSNLIGMAMYGVIVNVMSFINLFAGPVALQNIGYKYVFVSLSALVLGKHTEEHDIKIFVGWDCVEAFLWWLLAVETVGRSLEELEDVFNLPYPAKGLPKRSSYPVTEKI